VPTWRAAVRSVAERSSVSGADSNLGLTVVFSRRLQRLVRRRCRPKVNMTPDFGFYVLWPWPLTFSTEKNGTALTRAAANVYADVDFFCGFSFSSYEPVRNREMDRQTDRQTDGRARRVMQLLGRPHNNRDRTTKREQERSSECVYICYCQVQGRRWAVGQQWEVLYIVGRWQVLAVNQQDWHVWRRRV